MRYNFKYNKDTFFLSKYLQIFHTIHLYKRTSCRASHFPTRVYACAPPPHRASLSHAVPLALSFDRSGMTKKAHNRIYVGPAEYVSSVGLAKKVGSSFTKKYTYICSCTVILVYRNTYFVSFFVVVH